MEYGRRDEKLEEIYRLAKSNNKMLRGIRRRAIIGTISKLLFLAVVVGVPLWLYYQYAQPIMGDLMGAFSQFQEVGTQLQEVGSGLDKLKNIDPSAIDNILKMINSVPGL